MVEWVGQNRETDEEQDEDCDEGKFWFAMVKYVRDGEGGSQTLGVGNCIWDGSELELAWSKTIFQYFYYLVFWIHWFERWVMFHIEKNSYFP